MFNKDLSGIYHVLIQALDVSAKPKGLWPYSQAGSVECGEMDDKLVNELHIEKCFGSHGQGAVLESSKECRRSM